MSEKRKDNRGRILRNGEVQRADGQYMFRYTDATGKRKAVYSWKLVNTDKVPEGKRCKESLRDMEKLIQRDSEDEIRTSEAENLSVNDLFSSFMEIRTDLKTTTRCNYICLYDKHVRESIGYKKIKSVKHTDIQKLYLSMINDEGLQPSTVQGVHAIIFQIFENAVLDNIIRSNPSSNALKSLRKTINMEQEKRHALTELEQSNFINYIYKTPSFNRWANLFTVLLGTGMRIGEALGLRECDCDFENCIIDINHSILYKTKENSGYSYRISEPKTKAGLRTIPMFPEVKIALLQEIEKNKRYRYEPFIVDGYKGFIFLNNCGKVFTPGSVYEAIQNIVYSYNREETSTARQEGRDPQLLPKFGPHTLRHTFCTRMCENIADVKVIQDVMGHKNISTTMDVYSEATEQRKQDSFANLSGKIKLR